MPIAIADIRPGVICRTLDPLHRCYGRTLTILLIEDDHIVRFVDPPFDNFGVGIHHFIATFELVSGHESPASS